MLNSREDVTAVASGVIKTKTADISKGGTFSEYFAFFDFYHEYLCLIWTWSQVCRSSNCDVSSDLANVNILEPKVFVWWGCFPCLFYLILMFLPMLGRSKVLHLFWWLKVSRFDHNFRQFEQLSIFSFLSTEQSPTILSIEVSNRLSKVIDEIERMVAENDVCLVQIYFREQPRPGSIFFRIMLCVFLSWQWIELMIYEIWMVWSLGTWCEKKTSWSFIYLGGEKLAGMGYKLKALMKKPPILKLGSPRALEGLVGPLKTDNCGNFLVDRTTYYFKPLISCSLFRVIFNLLFSFSNSAQYFGHQ